MIIPIESRVVDFLELPGQGLAVAGLQHAAWREELDLGDVGVLWDFYGVIGFLWDFYGL